MSLGIDFEGAPEYNLLNLEGGVVTEEISPDFGDYNTRSIEVWDRLAEWWDDKIGDGNPTQDLLVHPASERMLELRPGDQVLDIACGAGRFTRRMAELGAAVVAVDHSEAFIRRACQRTTDNIGQIDYRVVDAADPEALIALGEARFDAAICTMALMDMASIEPLISTLPRLLKPGCRFVFSVTHPVFNSGTVRRIAEEHDRDGAPVTSFGAIVTDYMTPYVHMGIGIRGQPEPQHYFHRPIFMLLNTCFKHGFVLDRLEELALPRELERESGPPLSWMRFHEIPQVLVARMRLEKPTGG